MKSILKRDEVEERPEDTQDTHIRRVSFLPDVTLHSFDMVSMENAKKGEEVMTSTQVSPPMREESPMDMTEPIFISPKTVDPKANSISNNYTSTADEMMEFTGPQVINGNEESMELTGTHAIIMSQEKLNKHNSTQKKPELSPPEGPAELSIPEKIMSQAMEFTQVLPKFDDPISPLGSNIKQQQDQEDTMEFTQIVPKIQDYSNKKRKLNDNSIEKLSSPTTPPKQHIGDTNVDIEGIEKMSPIKISYDNTSISKVGDLGENSMSRISEVLKNKSIIDRDTDNYAYHDLEEASDENTGMSDEETQLSLENYLSLVNKEFLVDTKSVLSSVEDVVEFKSVDEVSRTHLRYNQLTSSLNIEVPTLEIKTFIINELMGRIKQSKSINELENDLKGTTKKGSMFLKFYNNNDEEHSNLEKELSIVQRVCGLQSQKEWFEWRIRQLDGFKEVLTDNLEVLNEEYASVMEEMKKVKETKFKIMELKETLQREIRILKEISPVTHRIGPTLEDKLTIAKIQTQLKKYSVDINRFGEIKNRKLELEKKINNQTELLAKFNQEQDKVTNKKLPLKSSFRTLEANFNILQELTGVTFQSFQDSILVIKFVNIGGMKIDIDMDQTSANNISLGFLLSQECVGNPIFELIYWLTCKQLMVYVDTKTSILSILFNVVAKLRHIYHALVNLSLLFQIKTNKEGEDIYIEASEVDQYSHQKVTYVIKLSDFVTACENDSNNVPIEVRYQNNVPQERVSKLLLDKGSRIFPWLKIATIITSPIATSTDPERVTI
ncbi:kinetochore-microtubule binding complex subunit SPC105 RNJ42_03219 [Nakaseomyces bracarensis]|uniref:kinetochore-microtubule binding complex subunit SPC105 n=1 Tax=Nakaseomyces bracarensis TaxID=273131 RepID=UPI00387280CA